MLIRNVFGTGLPFARVHAVENGLKQTIGLMTFVVTPDQLRLITEVVY